MQFHAIEFAPYITRYNLGNWKRQMYDKVVIRLTTLCTIVLLGNTMAKRVELEKAEEIDQLKKDLKETQKQVKLGKSQIETFTRSMKKQVWKMPKSAKL